MWLPALGLVALVALAWWSLRREPAATVVPATPSTTVTATVAAPTPRPEPVALPSPPPAAAMKVETAGVPEADLTAADRLAGRLEAHMSLTTADLGIAEDLLARYPGQDPLRTLLGGVLVSLAGQEKKARRFDQALLYLRRAVGLRRDDTQLRSALVDLLLETSDWTAAESAAREWLATTPRDAEAFRNLALALMRQDRNREAEEALLASLDIRNDPATRALLDHLRSGLVSEKGMKERQLAYFHVRYDGEAHEDVGREILRALERHRATLVRTFDHEPTAAIPVILFTSQGYYDATGAPPWAGGHYDSMDGRIRLPIGGLGASLTSDMDRTLIHELTHAFVFDRSQGVAPRELHEGLAQYMEGRRVASMLTAPQLQQLADGRAGGVGGFYVQALSFVEYLMGERGQGGINDLLRAMAETGSVDEAFRRVYGRDAAGLRQAWAQRLRQQYGS